MKKGLEFFFIFFIFLYLVYGGYNWQEPQSAPAKIEYWLLSNSKNVYFLTQMGSIYELSTLSGDIMPVYNSYKKVASPAILVKQIIIFGTEDNEVIAYSLSQRKILWTYLLSKKEANLSAKIKFLNGNEKLVLVVYDKKMVGLNPETGAEIFSKYLKDGKTAAVFEDKVLVLDGEELYCYTNVGRLLWFAKVGESYKTLPVYEKENNMVFFASASSSNLFAFDGYSGTLLWYYPVDGFLFSEPIVKKDKVVFGTASGELVALSIKEGKEIYKKQLASPIIGRGELLAGKYAFFPTTTNKVIGFDIDSGEIVFSHSLASLPAYLLLFNQNTLLVSTKNNRIYSLAINPACSILSPKNGEEVGKLLTIEGVAFSLSGIKNVQISIDGEFLPALTTDNGKFVKEINLEGKANGPIKIECLAVDGIGQMEKNAKKYKTEVIYSSLKEQAKLYAYIKEGQSLNPGQEFNLYIQDKYSNDLKEVMVEYLNKRGEYSSPLKLKAPADPGVYSIVVRKIGYEERKINFEVKDNLFLIKIILFAILFIVGYGLILKYLKGELFSKKTK
ncbi:MAG: PQQ-binding-like beta-propeller repeat protein [Candidatus Micrarchaeota archaeon]|nr:PQQ-binding-like beta-propeller repeat protein [Candidatus Micrarchaeota archaeon]